MKINLSHPNILRIEYRPDVNDEGYSGCMWANFDMDMGTDTLTITSDCGTYSYGYWSVGPGTFLKFLSGLDENYLLGKLSKRDKFDLDGTMDLVMEALECEEIWSTSQIKRLTEDLKARFDTREEDGKTEYAVLEAWNDDHCLDMCDLWEFVAKDYSTCAKRIVGIFVEHIQPKLKELWKRGIAS